MIERISPRQFLEADGGHLITDQFAPAWWVLADAEGNDACVATVLSRD